MANPIKGEVAFEAGGARYVLVMDVNAICTLESLLGRSVDEIAAAFDGGATMTLLRSAFWAGLGARHPELTEHDAGRILTELMSGSGGPSAAAALIAKAFAAAFPSPTGDANAAAGPRRGRRGTGPSS